MTTSKNDKKSLADPGAAHLELKFYPYRDETQVALVVAYGVGARATRLRVWAGLLPVGRSDLHGLRPSECAVLLTDNLRALLIDADGQTLAQEIDSATGEAVGVPLGTTGGTVMQDELPLG